MYYKTWPDLTQAPCIIFAHIFKLLRPHVSEEYKSRMLWTADTNNRNFFLDESNSTSSSWCFLSSQTYSGSAWKWKNGQFSFFVCKRAVFLTCQFSAGTNFLQSIFLRQILCSLFQTPQIQRTKNWNLNYAPTHTYCVLWSRIQTGDNSKIPVLDVGP